MTNPPIPGNPEMVERGARILEPQAWAALGIGDTLAYKSRRTSSLRKSRKFIAAMREPTEDMLAAGDSMMPQIAKGEDITTGRDALAEAWPEMIDAALEEPRE